MRVSLILSGGLGFDMLLHCSKSYNITAVPTNYNSNAIIDFANKENIPVFINIPRKSRALEFITIKNIDLLLSINYL
jgi:hypothetical protein